MHSVGRNDVTKSRFRQSGQCSRSNKSRDAPKKQLARPSRNLRISSSTSQSQKNQPCHIAIVATTSEYSVGSVVRQHGAIANTLVAGAKETPITLKATTPDVEKLD